MSVWILVIKNYLWKLNNARFKLNSFVYLLALLKIDAKISVLNDRYRVYLQIRNEDKCKKKLRSDGFFRNLVVVTPFFSNSKYPITPFNMFINLNELNSNACNFTNNLNCFVCFGWLKMSEHKTQTHAQFCSLYYPLWSLSQCHRRYSNSKLI